MGTRERESQGLSCHGNKPIGPSAALPECSGVALCACELPTTPVTADGPLVILASDFSFSSSLCVNECIYPPSFCIFTDSYGVAIESEILCRLNLHQPLCK